MSKPNQHVAGPIGEIEEVIQLTRAALLTVQRLRCASSGYAKSMGRVAIALSEAESAAADICAAIAKAEGKA